MIRECHTAIRNRPRFIPVPIPLCGIEDPRPLVGTANRACLSLRWLSLLSRPSPSELRELPQNGAALTPTLDKPKARYIL